MTRFELRKWWFVWQIFGIFLLVAKVMPAFAHAGGKPQITNEAAGPYAVSVWTQPQPLLAGEIHIVVAVAELVETSGKPEMGPAVLNAALLLTLTPQAIGNPVTVMAAHEASDDKFLYEAEMVLEQAGEYEVSLVVDGGLGQGQATFLMEIMPASHFSWWYGAILLIPVLFIWLRKRNSQHKSLSRPQRRISP